MTFLDIVACAVGVLCAANLTVLLIGITRGLFK